MRDRGDVIIDGRRLKQIRNGRLLTQEDFAQELGVKRNWVGQVESSGTKRVLRSIVVEIANKLKMRPDELLADSDASNVRAEQYFAPIPTFDLPLSAARWSMVEGMPEIADPRSIEQGLIRVRILGTCMEPTYASGRLIEFRIIVAGRDEVKIGMDVYVQKSDGLATFKRIDAVEGDTLTLTPINPEFAEKLIVAWQEVSRVAVAVAFVSPIDVG